MGIQKTITSHKSNQSNSSISNSMCLTTGGNQMQNDQVLETKPATAKELQEANPHLKVGQDCVTAAKNIRIELKRAFPLIKFSVKTSQYSMGNSVRIGWEDGPSTEQVDAITEKYQGGSFDGMTDCYDYSKNTWNEVFGSAKYVQTSRNYSNEFAARTIAEIGVQWHDGELPTGEDYKQGRLFHVCPDRHSETWQHLIYRAMYKKSVDI